MCRSVLIRAGLATALVGAAGISSALAQCGGGGGPNLPPAPVVRATTVVPVVPPLVTPSQKNNTALYSAIGGVLGAGLGLAITIQLHSQGTPNATLPARNFPPRNLSLTQSPNLGTGGGTGGGAGAGGGTGGAAGGGTGTPALRAGFNKPPPGETRYERNRILIDSTASDDVLDAIAQQHNMTRGETFRSTLTGRTLHIFTINGTTLVPDMIEYAATHPEFAGAQPNYLYVFAQGGQGSANSEP
jgi:hypothetical protein